MRSAPSMNITISNVSDKVNVRVEILLRGTGLVVGYRVLLTTLFV
jgi:hypothetical protein